MASEFVSYWLRIREQALLVSAHMRSLSTLYDNATRLLLHSEVMRSATSGTCQEIEDSQALAREDPLCKMQIPHLWVTLQ